MRLHVNCQVDFANGFQIEFKLFMIIKTNIAPTLTVEIISKLRALKNKQKNDEIPK